MFVLRRESSFLAERVRGDLSGDDDEDPVCSPKHDFPTGVCIPVLTSGLALIKFASGVEKTDGEESTEEHPTREEGGLLESEGDLPAFACLLDDSSDSIKVLTLIFEADRTSTHFAIEGRGRGVLTRELETGSRETLRMEFLVGGV